MVSEAVLVSFDDVDAPASKCTDVLAADSLVDPDGSAI